MAMNVRPEVEKLQNGGKYWENQYDEFYLKAYLPKTEIDGQVNNYTFRAPLILIFEEEKRSKEEAIRFAEDSGLAKVASKVDSSVLFVYPTAEGGWKNAKASLYASLIAEVKMDPIYEDGICAVTDFFKNEFKGYFIRGAKFRADIYSYGASADYVAQNLLTTLQGEYLWGPGEITPAMCSMERLSVTPTVNRKDIAVISVSNNDSIDEAFAKAGCENLLVKDKADYEEDYYGFVKKFKMWCGKIEFEPNFDEYNMVEEVGHVEVKTSPDNRIIKDIPTHKVGYFSYYNKGLFDNGPVPLLLGFHGGGDSSMYLTFVTEWWEIAHRYGFLFVSLENHQYVTATEVMEVLEGLKQKYKIDEHRIYATGFSMGSGKTWDMFQEYPEVFAGIAPHSALFPIHNNPFGKSIEDGGFNLEVPVPVFYSGGEESFVAELPCQMESALDRVQYLASTNKLNQKFEIKFEDREKWENPIWGCSGERIEKFKDESRGSTLTVHYFTSEDGVCRTALSSVSGQVHECRPHSCETSWKFISQFTR